MGKTKRNIPGWAKAKRFKKDTNFLKFLASDKASKGKGLSPKYMGKEGKPDGEFAGEDIRKPKTKKFFKRLHRKKNRKDNKKVEESTHILIDFINEGSLGFKRGIRLSKLSKKAYEKGDWKKSSKLGKASINLNRKGIEKNRLRTNKSVVDWGNSNESIKGKK